MEEEATYEIQPCSVCPHFRPCILTPCSLHGTCPERKTRSELEEDEDIAQTEITAENVPYAGSCRAESPPGSAQHALQRVSSVRLYLRARRPKRPRPSEISISSPCLPCWSWSARHVAAPARRSLAPRVGPGVCLVGRRMHVAALYPAPSRKSQCSSVCPVASGSGSPFLSSVIPCTGLGASLQWGYSYESGAVARRAHSELTSALFDLVAVFLFFVRDTAGF